MLNLDAAQLSTCVSCGLCLPHCPTYRVTGDEAYSPRGRIDAMRAVEGGLAVDDTFVDLVETCVQCRGCETACPSGVEFGALMEGTRASLASSKQITPWWQRAAYWALSRHRLLLAGSSVLAVAQRARLVPKRLGLARLNVRRPPAIESSGTDVWIFTGCVMDAWQRSTHVNTTKLFSAVGVSWQVPNSRAGCCGALHVHAGLSAATRQLAEQTMASMPGSAPIVVNSAGCGAVMKDYGHLLGTPEAAMFSSRVVDVNEFLAARVDKLPNPSDDRLRPAVMVQDPCHLRHVQRVVDPVRVLMRHVADVVELDDSGLCCGAGGAYSVMEPELAGEIRDRKLASIDRARERSGAARVASANPGCSMHLSAALDDRGVTVSHPVDIVAEALGL